MSNEIPLTIHTINKCNNYFYINNKAIKIPEGNYKTPFSGFSNFSTNKIEDTIMTELSNNNIKDISFSINEITGKIIFKSHGPDISLNFNTITKLNDDIATPLPFKLGWLFGYRLGNYNCNANKKIESEGIANFNGPSYIYLSINDFTNASQNNFIVTFSDSTLSKNIIGKIPYGLYLLDYKLYNLGAEDSTSHIERKYFGPVNIKKLHIKILNEYGDVVDFNNMDWSFSLVVEMLYD